jgi:hypothetical protein
METARYNLGAMQRTVNTPILSLVPETSMQSGFRYTLGKRDPSAGENVWIVSSKIGGPPGCGALATPICRDRSLLDRRRHGSGRQDRSDAGYAGHPGSPDDLVPRDERFQIDVPFEMREQCLDRGQVTATATYSHRGSMSLRTGFQTPVATQVTLNDRKTG